MIGSTLVKIAFILSLLANLFACTEAQEEGSHLNANPGYTSRICNQKDYTLYLLQVYNEGRLDYVSGWFHVGAHSCEDMTAQDNHLAPYYIQSNVGRYVPGPGEHSYDNSDGGILCLDRTLTFDKKASYSYDGREVSLKGICPAGMNRVPVASLNWTIQDTNDGGIYTAVISSGTFDKNDRIGGWKYVDLSESELDRTKREIAETEEKIAQVKLDLSSCSQQLASWQAQKIFALDTNSILNFAACSDESRRTLIKATIDEAKARTQEMLQSFVDSVSGFFARTLSQVDAVLSETFGFDQGALSSFLGASGSDWSRQPAASFAPDLNQALDTTYGRDHKAFLQAAHDGLKAMVEQGQKIQSQMNDEDEAFAYLKHATSVREHLEGKTLDKDAAVDAEGWPTDSPVPEDVRQLTIKQKIAPRDAERAARLETILKQWHNAGVPREVVTQRLAYLDAIRDLGDGFVAAAADVPEVLLKMRDILDGAILAAKDVTSCLVKVGVSGDFADWYEVTRGKDYCTGAELSRSGQVLSAAGLVFASAKFWRVLGEAVGISVYAKSVFRETDVFINSAKKFGVKTAQETKDFVQTATGLLGNEIATPGALENLVNTATSLAKDLKFTGTTASRMENVARHVPIEILAEAIKFGKKVPDPQGVVGAEKYVIDMFKNGKKYELEVVYRESDKTILHFLYK